MSTRSEHTPGPWYYYKDTDTRGWPEWCVDSDDVRRIAILQYGSAEERDTGEIDARLIAAAPELLDALKDCVRFLDIAWERSEGDLFGEYHNSASDAYNAACKAIKKATDVKE